MTYQLIKLAELDSLSEKIPAYAKAENTDLVLIKYSNTVSVLYGRCQHRGALMSDGAIVGDNIVCGLQNWDYRYDSGVSAYNSEEKLHKFKEVIQDGFVCVDKAET